MTEDGGALERSTAYYSPGLDLDAWFAVADRDYLELIGALDWGSLLGGFGSEPKLLDVGCGTGRFPELLVVSGTPPPLPIQYDYLDPSAHCLEQLRRALKAPFQPGIPFHVTVELFAPTDHARGSYDLVWCVHSLYAAGRSELPHTLDKLRSLLRAPGGRCLIYIAEPASFYIRFYDEYRRHVADRPGSPFTHADDVRGALRSGGLAFDERTLEFRHDIADTDRALLGEYLSKCAFDRHTPEAWLEHPGIGPFLEQFRREGGFSFPQRVTLLSFGP